jgi:hypothetical protein
VRRQPPVGDLPAQVDVGVVLHLLRLEPPSTISCTAVGKSGRRMTPRGLAVTSPSGQVAQLAGRSPRRSAVVLMASTLTNLPTRLSSRRPPTPARDAADCPRPWMPLPTPRRRAASSSARAIVDDLARPNHLAQRPPDRAAEPRRRLGVPGGKVEPGEAQLDALQPRDP